MCACHQPLPPIMGRQEGGSEARAWLAQAHTWSGFSVRMWWPRALQGHCTTGQVWSAQDLAGARGRARKGLLSLVGDRCPAGTRTTVLCGALSVQGRAGLQLLVHGWSGRWGALPSRPRFLSTRVTEANQHPDLFSLGPAEQLYGNTQSHFPKKCPIAS